MIHRMHLKPKFFDFIKNGTKSIELRLYDEKRQKIQLGDTIEFITDGETLQVEVVGLLRYQNFSQLINDFEVAALSDPDRTKEDLLDTLNEFYPPEKQAKYGVLGIRLKK